MKDILNRFAINTPIQEITEGGVETSGNFKNDVVGIVNVVIGILSFVAVIVIVIGGISYMTSSGDSGKVKKAKDTILYGVIGLVICVLAFAIVNFVIDSLINVN